jgi:hypothetical protein
MEGSVRIRHPNREKASSQVTRAFIILVMLVSAALIAIITFGGWSTLQGAQPISLLYLIVYVTMAVMVVRWSRGILPLAASLAVGLGVFAAIAAPAWFDRAHPDYADPALDPNLLGTLCILTVIVQAVLVVFAMIGFTQKWNIEVEESVSGSGGGAPSGQPRPAGATG